jgi:hypothetical protein
MRNEGRHEGKLVSLACLKAKDFAYPHELWTTRLLARHARTHATAAGHACLTNIAPGTVCKILAAHEIKPHKVRYYRERCDEALETKMAEVLCDCVYREVAILKESESRPAYVAIISYDEKPGIQAIGNTASDRHSLERTRRSRATTNTSAMAHSVCWPGSTADRSRTCPC